MTKSQENVSIAQRKYQIQSIILLYFFWKSWHCWL